MALAATRLIPMRKNKGKSIGACLHNHTSYIQNPDKTEQGELVSSYQCSPLTVDEEFLLTKRLYEQTTGRSQKSDVIAYQVRQSFKPGEVTPEEANRIGYEFAERFLKGKHAFIVATHTDRAHIHNHIIYNSTALDGTRKFRDFYFSALAVQRLSDLICLEHQLAKLPECVCEMRYIDSALLTPCAEYQRVLRTRKVEEISASFSEYVANEPRVSYRDGRYHVFDGQNTIEARIACNGGHDLPILCKVFHGLSKKDEALLFAVQTGISTDLTAGERLRADIVAEDEDACAFVAATEATGATFALDGIRAEWKIYCIRSAYYIYKNYGSDIYQEALKIIVEAWWGDSDSFLSGILHGVTRFVAMYRDEYSRERLIARLSTVHPKTITKNARKDTGNTADRHMKQILEIYNGSSRSLSLPVKR